MSWLVSALTWSGVALVVLGFGWAMAKRAGRVEAEKRQAEADRDAAERISHAINDSPRDPAALAQRLRDGGGL